MKSIVLTTLAALFGGLLLVAAPVVDAAGNVSGQAARETRALTDFAAIAQNGAIDLLVRQAATESVEVEADASVLPEVETVVEAGSAGRTLVIRMKPGLRIRPAGRVLVTVNVVRLTSLSSAGSGSVVVQALKTPSLRLVLAGAGGARLQALETEQLDVRLSGSGDVTAQGSATRAKLSIAGSGDADLAALTTAEMTVSIAGSGDANVSADKSLTVSVAGSGDVRYGGAVTAVKSSVAGSGSVRPR